MANERMVGSNTGVTPARFTEEEEQSFPPGILALLNEIRRTPHPTKMQYLILYDIESNKVRRVVPKFLLRYGCKRIQKSVFLGSLSRREAELIRERLTKIQRLYENEDSILMFPITRDTLGSIACIGKSFNFKALSDKQVTIFF